MLSALFSNSTLCLLCSAGLSIFLDSTTSSIASVTIVRIESCTMYPNMHNQPKKMMSHSKIVHPFFKVALHSPFFLALISTSISMIVMASRMAMKTMSAPKLIPPSWNFKNNDSIVRRAKTPPPRLKRKRIWTCSRRGRPTSELSRRAFTVSCLVWASSHPLFFKYRTCSCATAVGTFGYRKAMKASPSGRPPGSLPRYSDRASRNRRRSSSSSGLTTKERSQKALLSSRVTLNFLTLGESLNSG
mmetsp:Transcript_88706/g.153494  ORF Transcript_88706/g.153494 Transcript_88706/m.153494 type:complete len:245 (-) Transcript_88706:806-1540(-)